MTNGVSEARPDRSEALFARKTILEYEGFRAKIDMAKPQLASCHLFACRVNTEGSEDFLSFVFARELRNLVARN